MGMDPATIGLMLSVFSTATSYIAGQDQADAANKAAWDNYNAQKATMDQQALEIAQDANNQESERSIQAKIEQAKIRTIAGEAGVAGNSVDAQLKDSTFQESRDIASIETNKANALKQNRNELNGSYSRAKGQANEAESKRPSLLGAGLQIGTAANTYNERTALPTKTGGSDRAALTKASSQYKWD